MSGKTLIGRWKGGIRDSLVRIEMKPDGSCCATWAVEGSRETGNMFGKLFDKGTKFKGYWVDPPANLDSRGNTFEMALAPDGDRWECHYKKRGSDGGTWVGVRAGSTRKPGSRLSTKGVARDRAVFDRLVAPKDHTKTEAARQDVLAESMRTATMRETGALNRFEALTDDPPSLAVGDPYDDSSKRRHAQSSRLKGRQLVGGSTSGLHARLRDSRTEYIASEYEDRSTVSRRLKREARAKAAASASKDAASRPAFAPSSKDASRPASDVFLSSVPAGTVGKNLFELASKARAEATRPRRKVIAKDTDRPPYSASAAPSQGPIARQRHRGLTLEAGTSASEARIRPASAKPSSRVKEERPVWRIHVGTSPLDRQPFVGLITTEAEAREAHRRRRESAAAAVGASDPSKRPLSAPLHRRNKHRHRPVGGERPPFTGRAAPGRGAPTLGYAYCPEGEHGPTPAERREAMLAAKEAAIPAFRPTGKQKSRLTPSIALKASNLSKPPIAATRT